MENKKVIADSFKKILFWIILGTILSAVSLIAIVVFTNPYCEGHLGKVLFFISIFLFFLGIFTIAGFCLRKWIIHKKTGLSCIRDSFRQGILFSLILTILLFLQMIGMFNWGSVMLIMGVGIISEGALARI
ncbi:hypothetical protein D4R87_01695 [bacterium]|nr:MAG: hypothetical protein D4R87_01695 [bacterium]